MTNRQEKCRLILFVAFGVMLTSAAMADTIVTGPVDQAGFQALVDAASPGDTISCLGGVYDFSDPGPVWLSKKLAILAEDDDDPPVFVGDGTFFTDAFTGNNGFAQWPGSFIEALKLEGLHFEDFDRTLMFPNSNDHSETGCPLIPGAGARNIEILENTIRNSRRGVQAFGGPFEDFVIEVNDIETIPAGIGILIVGSTGLCEFDNSVINLVRPANGVIQENHVKEGNVGIFVFGSEETSVKENHVAASLGGILVGDDQAFYLPDDGPISLGSVEENVVSGAIFGIIAEGPTTITDAKIKENEISGALVGILLDFGANGFEVESNEFAGITVAEIWLGFDESGDPFAFPPDTINNVVKAGAGDRVFDFGIDNDVEIDD